MIRYHAAFIDSLWSGRGLRKVSARDSIRTILTLLPVFEYGRGKKRASPTTKRLSIFSPGNPIALTNGLGARHQNSKAQRRKNALRAKVPHPSLSHPGEGVKPRAKGELHCSMIKYTVSLNVGDDTAQRITAPALVWITCALI